MRAAGRLPAVIYGHGEAPESVSLAHHEVEVALAHGARTLQVDLNGGLKPYLDHLAGVAMTSVNSSSGAHIRGVLTVK